MVHRALPFACLAAHSWGVSRRATSEASDFYRIPVIAWILFLVASLSPREFPSSYFCKQRHAPAGGRTTTAPERPLQWLLIEWPAGDAEPSKYVLSTLPEDTPINELVGAAHQRWRIERDYQDLKQDFGLGHYEGRGWRGFHHHATLCIAAYGFLVAERNRFSPSVRVGNVGLPAPEPPPDFRPRGSPRSTRAA